MMTVLLYLRSKDGVVSCRVSRFDHRSSNSCATVEVRHDKSYAYIHGLPHVGAAIETAKLVIDAWDDGDRYGMVTSLFEQDRMVRERG